MAEIDTAGLASVVQVDRNEEIAAICGRVDTAPTYAVVIHAPGGNRALSREIGIRRLLRHVEESGKTVAIATSSLGLASRARQVGIPVARKPHHVRWDGGGRAVVRVAGRSILIPAIGRWLQLAAICAVALVLALALFTVAPKGTIIVYPASETLERTVTLSASGDITEIDVEELRVPATQVSSTRTITIAVPTTGSLMVGTQPAAITVAVTNPTTAEVTLPAGTVFRTIRDDLQFELLDDATVSPGETAFFAAQAVQPGEFGNVKPESITGFADPQFAVLAATNAGNGAGGLDAPRPAVDARDVAQLRQLASQLDTARAVRETLIADRPHDAIFLNTAEVSIDLGDPSEVPGTLADVVLLDVRVTVSALAVVSETLDEVARTVLRGEQTGEFIPGTVTAVETGANQVDGDSGIVRADFLLRGEFARNVTSDGIESAVKGRSTEGARSTLAERYGIDDSEVRVSPGWAPRLPRFGFRIDVEMRSRLVEAALEPGDARVDDRTASRSDEAATAARP